MITPYETLIAEAENKAKCRHECRTGGNDYIYCAACGLQWDYRRETEQEAILKPILAIVREQSAALQVVTQERDEALKTADFLRELRNISDEAHLDQRRKERDELKRKLDSSLWELAAVRTWLNAGDEDLITNIGHHIDKARAHARAALVEQIRALHERWVTRLNAVPGGARTELEACANELAGLLPALELFAGADPAAAQTE